MNALLHAGVKFKLIVSISFRQTGINIHKAHLLDTDLSSDFTPLKKQLSDKTLKLLLSTFA